MTVCPWAGRLRRCTTDNVALARWEYEGTYDRNLRVQGGIEGRVSILALFQVTIVRSASLLVHGYSSRHQTEHLREPCSVPTDRLGRQRQGRMLLKVRVL